MLAELIERLRGTFRREGGRDRVSVLLPFLIISIGLGALAWRSYYLSMKMERGANTVAVQYAAWSAEIGAKRVDAAVRAEMGRVSDEWQQMDRRGDQPTSASIRDWLSQHDWMVAAIYVPDDDPANSIYVNEIPADEAAPRPLTREFFTASGMVRYSYDPQRLVHAVGVTVSRHPVSTIDGIPGTLSVNRQAEVALVRGVREGLERATDGFAYVSALAPPLDHYGIRAFVPTGYGASGWQNQRVISAWVSLMALGLTAVGVYLALRGINKEAETTRLRGDLIANVSHELRTPLSMIRLGAETLKRAKLKEKERQEIEDQILREVLLLSHLVENVLDVARIQNRSSKALAFTPVEPDALIRNLVSTYESWINSRGFAVTLHLGEEIEQQMWDRDAVSRALLNLIDNAIKYSGDVKLIDVVLRGSPTDVIIEVKDRGIGIDPKDLARIFEPYYRAKFSDTITRRGAGLGLTLVRQILESHGGKVEIESQLGEGSTFRLLFPRAMEATHSAPAPIGRAHEAW